VTTDWSSLSLIAWLVVPDTIDESVLPVKAGVLSTTCSFVWPAIADVVIVAHVATDWSSLIRTARFVVTDAADETTLDEGTLSTPAVVIVAKVVTDPSSPVRTEWFVVPEATDEVASGMVSTTDRSSSSNSYSASDNIRGRWS